MTARRDQHGFPAVAAAMTLFALALAGCSSTTTTPAPTAAAPEPSPTIDSTFTKAFVSTVGGYSLRTPESMDAKPAKAAAPASDYTWSDEDPFLDQFFGEGVGPIDIVSEPLSRGQTADAWTKDELDAALLSGSSFPSVCATKNQTEPITVDGHAGTLDVHCAPALLTAIVPAGDRIYAIDLHGDPPDRAWFTAFLATIHLDPATALPAPAGSPVPTHS
jgi:hypothetical protein